jgi:hypothetical protein
MGFLTVATRAIDVRRATSAADFRVRGPRRRAHRAPVHHPKFFFGFMLAEAI